MIKGKTYLEATDPARNHFRAYGVTLVRDMIETWHEQSLGS